MTSGPEGHFVQEFRFGGRKDSRTRPGRRVYSGYKELPRVFNGYGTLIVSTSEGVTTGRKAVEKKVGGELICTVW
jgi:small subunit ribosomal protein S8